MPEENTINKEESVELLTPEPSGMAKSLLNLNRSGRKKNFEEKFQDGDWPIAIMAEGDGTVAEQEGVQIVFRAPLSLQNVLSEVEKKLYEREVKEWFASHPDWNMKEDHDDIHMIAVEKVIQYRLMAEKKKDKKADVDKEYHSSVMRMQEFRKNLSARRADRLQRKQGSGGRIGSLNIAVIAGRLDKDKILKLNGRAEQESLNDEKLFPKG